MSAMAEKVMRNFYLRARGDAKRLPWHRDEPGRPLGAAVTERGGRGRALDVGCGAGVLSVWLAQRGLQVTGIDMFSEAIDMARSHARFEGFDVALGGFAGADEDVVEGAPEVDAAEGQL